MAVEVICRSMRKGANGRPEIGKSSSTLGVRPHDLMIDPDGRAVPRTGGMSVAPDDPRRLPKVRRPFCLGGTGRHPVFVTAVPALRAELLVRVDRPPDHASVEPAAIVAFDAYEEHIHSTVQDWNVYHE